MRERFLFCRLQHHFTPSLHPRQILPLYISSCEFLMVGIENNFPSASGWVSGPPPFTIHPNCPLVPGRGERWGGREEMIDGVENEGYQKTSQLDRMGMDWEFKSSTDVARRNRFNVLIIISLKQEKWATLFRGTTKFQRKSERWKEKLKKVPKTKVLLINGATG